MSHAIVDVETIRPVTKNSKITSKSRSLFKNQHELHNHLAEIQTLYTRSQLSKNIAAHIGFLVKNAKTPIRKVLSLGLGNLSTSGQSRTRILKQFVIFIAIRDELEKKRSVSVTLYAQDPVFTRADEAFLSTHSIAILRTISGTSLGEASAIIDASTLVYSPFLTLEAYQALLFPGPKDGAVRYLIGDDFTALERKWPKKSMEWFHVEILMKGAIRRFRRRMVCGEGFWEEGDGAFEMGAYVRGEDGGKGKEKAKI